MYYVLYYDKKYWLNRAFWFESGQCTVYEFVTDDGDVYTVDVRVGESLTSKEMLFMD